jgi:hypothetical protein
VPILAFVYQFCCDLDYSWISLNLLKAMLEYDHDPNFEEIDCVCTALCTLVELIVVCLENLECEENRI